MDAAEGNFLLLGFKTEQPWELKSTKATLRLVDATSLASTSLRSLSAMTLPPVIFIL
jgi:hypothetical protein